MPKKTWRVWPDSCPECGGEIEIHTSADEEGKCYDGDEVHCTECDMRTGMTVYENGECEIQSV
jgi:hypothetical protein